MAAPALSESYRTGAVIAGKYRLVKRIGSGAMGAVWSAVNLTTSGQVALKLIERSEPELRQRLLREARSCASIRHKNVVQVHDVGETDSEDPFLVMELLQGQTLGALLHERRRLPPDEAALLGRDIARGLSAAHEQGIVHRDLKPANIFLHEQSGEPVPVVKVLDFGVSKNLALSDGLRTMTGSAVGSPMYMSPEQARAEPDIDGRADVWSLGVVLYEMLTGERPFSGETAEVVFKITHAEIPRASRRLRRLDPGLDDIVARCLTRDRSQRTESAEEVARQLDIYTSPAARGPLPSLMDIGLGEGAPASADAGSDNAAFSPGLPPVSIAAPSSPGLSSTERERSSSRHPSVSRSGSRPLSGSSSQSGILVDQDAATRHLSPGHPAPLPPASRPSAPVRPPKHPGPSDDDAMYGPRGTVRIDPLVVQAAIDAKRANSPRPGQGTLPLLQAPPPMAPPDMGSTVPLLAQSASLVTPPVPLSEPEKRGRTLLWMVPLAVFVAFVLAVVVWLLLRPAPGVGDMSDSAEAGAPLALSASAQPTTTVSVTSVEAPAPSASVEAPVLSAPSAPSGVVPVPPASSSPTVATVPPARPIAKPTPRPPAPVPAPTKPKCTSKFGVGCK